MAMALQSLIARVHEQITGQHFELDRAVAALRDWAGIDNKLLGVTADAVQRLVGGLVTDEGDWVAIQFTCEELLAMFALPVQGTGPAASSPQPADGLAAGALAGLLLAATNRMKPRGFTGLWFSYISDCAYYWRGLVEDTLLIEYFAFVIGGLQSDADNK